MGILSDIRESWEAKRGLARAQRRAEAQVIEVAESLASRAAADLADEDTGWQKLGDGGSEYSNADLRDMRKRCRQLYEIDPTVSQAVFILQAGALGNSVIEPKAVDSRVQEVLDGFWSDEDNELALTSRDGLELLHLLLMIEGERFLTLHVAPTDAEVRLADVEAGEITRVITHPENRRRPVLYRREYWPQAYSPTTGRYEAGAEKTVEYLRDWRLAPEVAGDKWDDDAALQELLTQVEAQTRDDAYCYHARLTGLGLRPAPGVWRAFEWAKAHGKSLSTMMTLASALAMFAWQKKVKTSSADTLKKFAQNTENPRAQNAQGPGAVQVGNQNVDLSPINVSTGGTQVQEATARQMHLQQIRTFGFGEHWYSDATRGNLATASAMELPAVWRIENHQALIQQILSNVCAFAVAVAQDRGGLPLDVDAALAFNFPDASPSTAGETATLLQALTLAAQAGVVDPREASAQAYQALGTQDINAVMERQYPDEAKADGAAPVQVQPTQGLEPQPATEAADVREAVVESRPFGN
jgi:hypothetical protein